MKELTVAAVVFVICKLALTKMKKRGRVRAGDISLVRPRRTPPLNADHGRDVKIGVVCMTKHPVAFDTWLRHHREHLGAVKFFVCVDDTPHLANRLEHETDCVVTRSSGDQAYFKQMDRQGVHVNNSIVRAVEMDVTHLLHIDDDELLYCPYGVEQLKAFVATAKGQWLQLRNIEAVYTRSECDDPFVSTRLFCVRPSMFTAYANGKGMAVLAHRPLSHGPHAFQGESTAVPSHLAVVLHYESACVERWRQKYANYAKDTPDACRRGDIPFKFYCDSIEAAGNDEVWHRYKQPTRHDNDGLVSLAVVRTSG